MSKRGYVGLMFLSGLAGLMAGVVLGWVAMAGAAFPAPMATVALPRLPSPTSSPALALIPSPTLPPTATATATASPTAAPSPTPLPTATATPWPSGAKAVIGYSVAGRPLEVYRFGTGPDQRLIIAGIHGGYEWNTVDLAKWMISRLQLNPQLVPEGETLFILPVLNIDGYHDHRGSTYGRANAHGVDLNRNFSAFWQADWDRTHCWNALPITAGPHPFSEPETQALRDFLEWPGIHITALISYHSAAHTIFAGGQPPTPASVSLARALAQASGYTFPPEDIGCPYTGQLIDWAAQQGIAAVDVELTTHHDLDEARNWRLLLAFLQWQP